jgi:rSAM/selenodomain-associated transferase 1
MSDDTGRVLGVFAKRPDAGRVKTRLAADTSPEWAARVAAAFLHDTLTLAAAVPVRRVLGYAPAEAGDFFAGLAGTAFAAVPQADGDLGRRMAAFFADRWAEGATRAVLIGTDSPSLPASYLSDAFTLLETTDVVFGPAADGGYYLIGLANAAADLADRLFRGIDWSTSAVLGRSIDRLAGTEYRVGSLPPWYDVDTLDDWQALRGHVMAMRRSGGGGPALVHTSALWEVG